MLVTINGTLQDINGAALTTTGTVKLSLPIAFHVEGLVETLVEGSIKSFSITAGAFSLSLIDTDNMVETGVYYIFTVGGMIYKKTLPAVTPVDFWDLPDVV